MTKVRIPVRQVDKYKSFCKSFSRHLEAGTGIRLRGNVLLNTIARAAGHDSHTALLLDAGVYGAGSFRSELLPHQLAATLAAQLELQPMQVHFMLDSALVDAYSDEIADAIRETVQSNPLPGVTPGLLSLPDPERWVWGDRSRSYLTSLANTGAGQHLAYGDADALISDLQSAGDDAAKAIFANANHSVAVYLNQPDGDAEVPYLVYLSDTGMCPEDEQSLTESFQKFGNMSFHVSELEAGELLSDGIRDAVKGR